MQKSFLAPAAPKHFFATMDIGLVLIFVLALGVSSTEGGLQTAAGPFVGNIGISADGLGISASSTGFIQAEIPLPGSTIVQALLYVKTISGAHLNQIGFGGSIVPVTELPHTLVDSPACCPDFFPTFRADVTSIVEAAVGSSSGIFNFLMDESVAITGIGTSKIDGPALFVVYSNPSLPKREIYLLEGGLTGPSTDVVNLPLLTPYAGSPAEMGVAISFSAGLQEPPAHDCPVGGMVTVITVNGQLLSPCAGNKDDGDANANGALMTVGGIDDDLLNPGESGVDDERYNLAPFLTTGDTNINMTFTNTSDDDSLFAMYVQIDAAGVPAIQITLDPPPGNNRYVINTTPTMPIIQARAKVINVTPDPTPATTFTWNVGLDINKNIPATCAIGSKVSYDKDIEQNTTTIGDTLFIVKFKNPDAFRGGMLKLTATAVVNDQTLSGETPDGLKIEGANPQRTNIQNEIDDSVPVDGFSGLGRSDIQDVLKRIACQESKQKQFNALANGGIGPVLISCDNGVGIFQITKTTPCPDPFVKCPNVLFSWPDNVTEGVQTYQGKVQAAKQYPSSLHSCPKYRDFITTINAQRQAAGLKKIPGFPAPQFTTAGLIGSDPPNQLLEDGVRGYNGFAGKDGFCNGLHEFIPDENFLLTVPNSELGGINNNPKVWRLVLPEERPDIGDPNYVNNVAAQSPQCGG